MPRYQITPNGQITDSGEVIGWVEGGTNLIFKEGVEVSGQARGYLERLLNPEGPEEATPPSEGGPGDATEPPPQPHAPEIPPAPKQDPRMGDKTPAYREWFRKHHTQEEYEKRYGGRKVSDTPGPLYGGGDIPEEQTWKDNPEVWFKSTK
jgi:hypothetical protein